MSDADARFDGSDPFKLTARWLEEARPEELNDPEAMQLATVDADGMPNVRTVLLKEIEADAFVFYTNYGSAKGQELDGAGKAAFVIHWKSLRRQVRARGIVEREDGAQADAYFKSRHPESLVGAWASRQSSPLGSRAELLDAVEEVKRTQGDEPERPPFWGGYRLKPLELEFWANGEFRLHDRFRWTRDSLTSEWTVTRLNP